MNNSNSNSSVFNEEGKIRPEINSIIQMNMVSQEVKNKCERAGIKKYVPDPNQRHIIYKTIAKDKTEEELTKFFRGEISLKPSKK